MGTRIVFIVFAVLAVGWLLWAYHHDKLLRENAPQIQIGDPDEVVRDLLGSPTNEGDCGSLTAVPAGCSHEFVYRYAFSLFNPQYQVIWLDSSGKVIGETRVVAP
jgi:hypothetical protein